MLALEGPDKQPRYKRYPVFLENANFETQLTEMIKGQKQRDVNNQLAQFEAIRFLQYLANQMERDRPLMESRLKSWVDDLIYQHPNYTEHSVEQFKAHLVEYIKKNKDKDSSNDFTLFQGSFPLVLASTKLKEIFNQVLNDSQNKKNYATKLTDIVNALYLSICSNIIVGGYILVQHSNNCSSELKISLADVLKAPEGINTEDTYWSLNLLKDYLKINTHAVLECGFFGGRSNFESNLSNLRDHYKKQFEAEAEAAAEAKKKQQATTSASM
ncbi:MAG: hypothetical protein EPN84_00620 [Legionella sp.]|nr:MAG: hypothetical protein EPN84_00620 [Legionella sp.]